MDNHDKMRIALKSLLNRDAEDAFVIFEEINSQKFIQFAGSINEPLFLDLPIQTLSPNELVVAKKLFAEYGCELSGYNIPDWYEGDIPDGQEGFQMDIGYDIEKAVEISMGVFLKVFGFESDFDLIPYL